MHLQPVHNVINQSSVNNTSQPDSADIPGGAIQLERGVRSEAESALLRQVIEHVGIDNVEKDSAYQAGPLRIEPEKEKINAVHPLELPGAKKKKVIKVNFEKLTYSSEKNLAKDEEEVKQKLTKFGVAILPDRLIRKRVQG